MTSTSIRDRIALVAHRSRAAWRFASGSLRRRLDEVRGADALLMYHRVLPDTADVSVIEPGMYVRASAFERHLDVLQSRWDVVSLSSILDSPHDGRPRVALTLDDGWRDNLETAWPILQRRNATATVFVVTDWCAAGRYGGATFIRPDEIRDLAAAGLEFGAHTMSHPALDTVDSERVRLELDGSRREVARWTGKPCRLFAYPYGRRTPQVERMAASLFDASVVVGGGWWHRCGDTACLPRISIHNDMASSRALFEERLVDGLEMRR